MNSKFLFFLLILGITAILIYLVKFRSPYLMIRNHRFNLTLARTVQEQETGLGYRNSLPENNGMLFLFNKPDYLRFWMKGMRFPLDIIYIHKDKIVTIYKNLPNPVKSSDTPTIYIPTQPADKVLEINAGLSDKYYFSNGDTIKFFL